MNFYHKMPSYKVTLTCGCDVTHRIAPPRKGDIVTCRRHGASYVLSREASYVSRMPNRQTR
jgi:hypothetical protein